MWGPEELRHVDFASGGSEITVHPQCLAWSLSQPQLCLPNEGRSGRPSTVLSVSKLWVNCGQRMSCSLPVFIPSVLTLLSSSFPPLALCFGRWSSGGGKCRGERLQYLPGPSEMADQRQKKRSQVMSTGLWCDLEGQWPRQ